MLLWFQLIVLCPLLFLICYLGTGSDEENIRTHGSMSASSNRSISRKQKYSPTCERIV